MFQTVKNIAKRHIDLALSVMAQREEINALASVVLSLAPQSRMAFDAQLEAERSKNATQREELRQQLLVLDSPFPTQERPN